jgi:hypothetical protein
MKDSQTENQVGAAACQEESRLDDDMRELVKEIRELHFSLEDEKESHDKNSKTWKVDRKVEKIDEVLEKYEITLQQELNTINSKYDLKIENLKQEVERKIRELREYESCQIDRIERERQRGTEGKRNEYDSYILKRAEEKKSLIKDKNLIVENIPDKVSTIKRRRLLQQKITDYNSKIKQANDFYKKTKRTIVIPENYRLEFLNLKKEEPIKVESKQPIPKEPVVVLKEEKKEDDEEFNLSESEKKIYEAMRKKYSILFPEEQPLPEKPSALEFDTVESTSQHPPVLQSTKQKKIPKMAKV